MSVAAYNNINKVYTADKEGALQQITRVICLCMARSFTVCGLDDKGNVLLIDQSVSENAWDLDFLAGKLSNKSLENLLKKSLAVFVETNKELPVPKAVYSESESEKWFRKIYFVESEEIVLTSQLKDKAYYLYTISADLKALFEENMAKPKFLPLAAYQFQKQTKADNIAQCCISADKAFVSLYKNKNLQWHKVFPYDTAEDIAYPVKLICQQQEVYENELQFQCTAVSNDLTETIALLSSYFPQFEDGSGKLNIKDQNWAATTYLFQQLNACV